MRESSSVVFTRGSLGQIASFVGATGLLTGFIALVWQGSFEWFVTLAFVLGLLGIALWAVFTPQEFIGFVTGRQARRGTIAVFSTLLLTGIVVLTYIVVERAVLTLDMTNAGEFTLSPETLDVINQINRPIRITGFYTSDSVASRDLDDQFFRLYEAKSDGMITRRYFDPAEQPELAEQFGAKNGDVYLSYLNADGSVDMSTTQWVPLTGKQERDMTQAIARLLSTGNFTVYFSFGSGELDSDDDTGVGTSNAKNLLRVNGFNTGKIDLRGLAEAGEPIPRDATAIVIAGAQESFTPDMIAMLDTYLDSGGTLFIMANETGSFLPEDSDFNTYLWENWGIRLLNAIVIDERVGDPSPWDIFSYAIYDSPITASLDPTTDATTAAQFYRARAIEVNPDPPVNNGAVIQSSEVSFAERDVQALIQNNTYAYEDGVDLPGPQTVVAYAFDAGTGGKIILVGDSDFITNGRIAAEQSKGNGYLFMDGIGWMTGFTERVSIAPQAVGVTQPFIFVSPQTLDEIAFFTAVVMPGIVLVLGAVVWFYRSRR